MGFTTFRRSTPDDRPQGRQLTFLRIYSIVQLPVGCAILYWVWDDFWEPGSTYATLFATGFTAFALLIMALNIRDAWFLGTDASHEDDQS